MKGPWNQFDDRGPLTDDEVRLIRADHLSAERAAAKFGVSLRTVHRIRSGAAWPHVAD